MPEEETNKKTLEISTEKQIQTTTTANKNLKIFKNSRVFMTKNPFPDEAKRSERQNRAKDSLNYEKSYVYTTTGKRRIKKKKFLNFNKKPLMKYVKMKKTQEQEEGKNAADDDDDDDVIAKKNKNNSNGNDNSNSNNNNGHDSLRKVIKKKKKFKKHKKENLTMVNDHSNIQTPKRYKLIKFVQRKPTGN